MKKLAIPLALLTWGIALVGPAAAGDNFNPYPPPFPVNGKAFVSFQCRIFSEQGGTDRIFGIDAVSASLPGACRVGSTCGGCAAALLGDGYTLDKAFGVTQANSGYAGPYFVFIK